MQAEDLAGLAFLDGPGLWNLESCSKALGVPIGDVLEDAKVICQLLLMQCSLFCVPTT